MSSKWNEGDAVVVDKNGLELEGFINSMDKKTGLIHVHTDRGPITLMANSRALRKLTPKDDKTETL